MQLTLELEQEADGRWIAEVLEIPGVLVYSSTPQAAADKARVLATEVIVERINYQEL